MESQLQAGHLACSECVLEIMSSVFIRIVRCQSWNKIASTIPCLYNNVLKTVKRLECYLPEELINFTCLHGLAIYVILWRFTLIRNVCILYLHSFIYTGFLFYLFFKLADGPHSGYLQLLNLFAYGTYPDYVGKNYLIYILLIRRHPFHRVHFIFIFFTLVWHLRL